MNCGTPAPEALLGKDVVYPSTSGQAAISLCLNCENLDLDMFRLRLKNIHAGLFDEGYCSATRLLRTASQWKLCGEWLH